MDKSHAGPPVIGLKRTPSIEPEAVASLVEQRLLRQMLERTPLIVGAGIFVGVLLLIALLRSGNDGSAILWAGILITVSLARLLIGRVVLRGLSAKDLRRAILTYSTASFFGGLSWAGLIFFSGTDTPFAVRLVVMVTLVGIPAAGLSTLGILRTVYFAFSLPIFGATVFWTGWINPHVQLEATLVATTYAVLISFMAIRYHDNLRRSIQREIENERLLHEVEVMNTELQRMAYEDPLTGVSNRRRFEDTARRMLERLGDDDTLVLMLIDMDRFKWVNDSLGHATGDQVLVTLAQRIQQHSRISEIVSHSPQGVARIGGDEFIALYRLQGDNDVHALAQRILEAATTPMQLGKLEYQPSVSIGIALAPEHANTLPDLLRAADTAMYQAKSAGGGRYRIAAQVPADTATVSKDARR